MKPHTTDTFRIAEEAAEWLHRLKDDDSSECQAAFTAWLKQSPRHMQELLMMTAVSAELEGIDPDKQIDIGELAKEKSAEVVRLQGPKEKRYKNRKRWSWGLAAGAAAVLAGAAIVLARLGAAPTYTTAIGEQRTVKLDDGSMIYLNTRSSVQVQYTAHGRDIRLQEGEALFVVAREARRPFRVAAGDATVRAVGTQFNVSIAAGGTLVSVVEGNVQVSTQSGRVSSLTAAGEEVKIAQGGGIVKKPAADVARAVAWRQRRLVFRDDTLADIVAEFNRYNRTPQFRIEGGEVRERRYTGTFDADDPASLQELLSRESDLQLERRDGEILIRPPRLVPWYHPKSNDSKTPFAIVP